MSLLELLVALAAAGLLMALLARVVADVADTRRWLQTRSPEQTQALQGRRLLQEALSAAWPDHAEQRSVWQADNTGLRFLSRPPAAFRHWGWMETELRWERRAGDKQVLLLQIRPLAAGSTAWVPEPVLLLESDEKLVFKYAGYAANRSWQSTWRESRALPAVVGLFPHTGAEAGPIWAAAPLRAFPGVCERRGSEWHCLVADELIRPKGL